MDDKFYFYKANVISVVDGDTCILDVDLGFKIKLDSIRVRLYGIDSPEIRGEHIIEAKTATEALSQLISGKQIILQSIKDSKDKYGRYLGILWITTDAGEAICVNEWLVSNGYAIHKEY
jgi:micrococcal nuclease